MTPNRKAVRRLLASPVCTGPTMPPPHHTSAWGAAGSAATGAGAGLPPPACRCPPAGSPSSGAKTSKGSLRLAAGWGSRSGSGGAGGAASGMPAGTAPAAGSRPALRAGGTAAVAALGWRGATSMYVSSA